MPKQEHKMTILLSDPIKSRLLKLAADAGISQGAICRQLINRAANMTYQSIASCASGQPCLCPHLHTPRPNTPPPEPMPANIPTTHFQPLSTPTAEKGTLD